MAWSIVGVSTNTVVTTTSLTLTEPAGVQRDDLLVACIAYRAASATSVTLPANWTLLSEQKSGNTTAALSTSVANAVMAYIARPASAPSFAFTLPAANVAMGQVIAYRGVRPAAPNNSAASQTTATGTTSVSVTGLTTPNADELLVAMVGAGRGGTWNNFRATTPATGSGATDTTTAPSSTAWTERVDAATTSGADVGLAVFDALKATAGATGNFLTTGSLSGGHAVIVGAFVTRPVPTAPTTFDPALKAASLALSNGNLTVTQTVGSAIATALSTPINLDAVTNYMEVTYSAGDSNPGIGIANELTNLNNYLGQDTNSIGLYGTTVYFNGASLGTITPTPAVGDVMEIIVNTNSKYVLYRNVTQSGPLSSVFSYATMPGSTQRFSVNFTGSASVAVTANWDGHFVGGMYTGHSRWNGAGLNEYWLFAAVRATVLAGQTVSLLAIRRLTTEAGAIVRTGIDAILARSRIMAADLGARVVTRIDAVLSRGYALAVDTGAVALAGYAANLVHVIIRTLVAGVGTFTLAGTPVETLRTRVLEAAQGAVTLTGNAADTVRGWVMAAAQGTVTLTGYAAGLVTVSARVMIASTGALLLAGTDAGLRYARVMAADTGVIALAGQTVNLVYGVARWLLAEIGALLLTGRPAALTIVFPTHYTLAAIPGAVALSGFPANLHAMLLERQPGPLHFGRPVSLPIRFNTMRARRRR